MKEVATIKKLISIVVPAYNEEDSVDELTTRLKSVFQKTADYEFEVVLIENGSTDRTYEKLMKIRNDDERFKILKLSRNFRKDGGVTAGLNYISGDAAVLMDADLQDPPEMIPEFIKKWEEGYENVYGIIEKREGVPFLRRMNSNIFYWLINKLAGGMIPKNVSDFRLIDRKVYRTINTMQERNRFVRGLFAWVGFKSIGINFDKPQRFAGVTNADTLKVIDLAMKGIMAHSYIPLKLITFMGIMVSLVSFVLLSAMILKWIIFGVPFAGYGSIMTAILILFGFLFTLLGIIGEYIGLIYEEVKSRPNYIVSEKHGL
jgi:polyisoprenyl-phosphate glycosyltransferase